MSGARVGLAWLGCGAKIALILIIIVLVLQGALQQPQSQPNLETATLETTKAAPVKATPILLPTSTQVPQKPVTEYDKAMSAGRSAYGNLNFIEATKQFDQAAKFQPGAEAYYCLGKAWEKRGDADKAKYFGDYAKSIGAPENIQCGK